MGKKRGGKTKKAKSANESLEMKKEEDEKEMNNVSFLSEPSETPESTNYLLDHQYEETVHDQYRVIADYVKSIQPLLDSLIIELQSSSTEMKPFVRDKRNLLIKQVFKEFKGRETAVMRDQRGSKVLEKVMVLLRQIAEDEIANPGSQLSHSGNDDEFTVIDALNAIKTLTQSLAGDAFENCTNCYASHFAQTLLGLLPFYVSIEDRIQPRPFDDDESAPTDTPTDIDDSDNLTKDNRRLSLADTFLYLFNVLRVHGIGQLMSHACGSHVIRACFLALAGYVPNQELHSVTKPRGKKQKDFKDPLPSRQLSMPEAFGTSLVFVIDNMVEAVSYERVEYAIDIYANPVIQLVLHILVSMNKSTSELQSKFVNLYLPNDSDSANKYRDQLDTLLESPSGSRLVEVLLANANPSHVHAVVWYFLKPERHLNKVAIKRYGNFFIQQLLTNKALDTVCLQCLIEVLDFKSVIESHCAGVIWKLTDACRRLRDGYKTTTTKLLEALEVSNITQYPSLWWSLLSCCSASSLQIKTNSDGSFSPDRFLINPIGCSITSDLLQFPKESIIPLLQAFKLFAKPQNVKHLLEIAKDRQGSWLFQTVLSSFSPVDPKSQARLVRLFLGQFQQLAFHPYGSFLVSAAYKISPFDLKRSIIEELLEKVDELRVANFALYKAIDFNKYLRNDEEWASKQQKKIKLKGMFGDLIKSSEKPQHRILKNEHQHEVIEEITDSNSNAEPRKKKRKQ